MKEQVIKEAEELIESHLEIISLVKGEIAIRFATLHAIKTQERVIIELELIYSPFGDSSTMTTLKGRIAHNKAILNHLKTLI